jgi:hypothetical protein
MLCYSSEKIANRTSVSWMTILTKTSLNKSRLSREFDETDIVFLWNGRLADHHILQ